MCKLKLLDSGALASGALWILCCVILESSSAPPIPTNERLQKWVNYQPLFDFHKNLLAKKRYEAKSNLRDEKFEIFCYWLLNIFGFKYCSVPKHELIWRKIVANYYRTRSGEKKMCKRLISGGEGTIQNWDPFEFSYLQQ